VAKQRRAKKTKKRKNNIKDFSEFKSLKLLAIQIEKIKELYSSLWKILFKLVVDMKQDETEIKKKKEEVKNSEKKFMNLVNKLNNNEKMYSLNIAFFSGFSLYDNAVKFLQNKDIKNSEKINAIMKLSTYFYDVLIEDVNLIISMNKSFLGIGKDENKKSK
jgi:hypothetical protein